MLVAGQTAVGKSKFATNLAAKYDGVVVNADALQVYNCWKVLTARPSAADESAVPHKLFGHVEWNSRYSVGSWIKDVSQLASKSDGRLLVVVGGTGLYFTALTRGLAEIPPVPETVRSRSEELISAEGIESLFLDLLDRDPETAARIDKSNPARIQRAWEVYEATGRGLSYWHSTTPEPTISLQESLPVILSAPPELISERVFSRLLKMVSDGALDECAAMLDQWDPSLPYSKALGASEFVSHLRGEISLEDAVAAAAGSTRQYAKRQRTWFRSNMRDWNWISIE